MPTPATPRAPAIRLSNTPTGDVLLDDGHDEILQDILGVHPSTGTAVVTTLAELFFSFSALPVEPPGQTAPDALPPGLDDPIVGVLPMRPEWRERPERPEHPDRPDRPEKPERPERPERPDPPANDDGQGGGGGPVDRGKGVSIDTAQALVLARFDADGSASLSLVEMLAVLDRDGQRTELAAYVETLFDALDDDGDSSLEGSEIKAALEDLDIDDDGLLGLGGRPQGDLSTEFDLIDLLRLRSHGIRGDERQRATAPTIESLATALIDAFDINANHAVERDELLKVLDPNGKRTKLAQLVDDGIDAIDANSDKSISVAELSAALALLDADDDGRLAAPERHAHLDAELGDIVALVGLLMPSVADLG